MSNPDYGSDEIIRCLLEVDRMGKNPDVEDLPEAFYWCQTLCEAVLGRLVLDRPMPILSISQIQVIWEQLSLRLGSEWDDCRKKFRERYGKEIIIASVRSVGIPT